jgi:hypothetical protein
VLAARILGAGTYWAGRQTSRATASARCATPPNKGMKLTKLRAAPVLQAEVPPCARAARMDAGTASQLIPGVGRTLSWVDREWKSRGR